MSVVEQAQYQKAANFPEQLLPNQNLWKTTGLEKVDVRIKGIKYLWLGRHENHRQTSWQVGKPKANGNRQGWKRTGKRPLRGKRTLKRNKQDRFRMLQSWSFVLIMIKTAMITDMNNSKQQKCFFYYLLSLSHTNKYYLI